MSGQLRRRDFLAAAAGGAVAAWGSALAPGRQGWAAEQPPFKTRLKKAMIIGRPDQATLGKLKDAGFDGAETSDWKATPDEAAKGRELAEKLGLRIHSVLRGWMQFNAKDPATVAQSIAETETALRAAAAYGADAVLLVPCRIGGMAMPDPWDFQIEFDEKTGHLKRVAAGDNEKYRAYIDAHDYATDSSREAVRKLIPVAQQTKVVIALENVWNNLWVKPDLFAWFVRSFDSPWVKAYLDLGNHVKYAPTEEWVKSLAGLVAKCHVKDFKLNADGRGGTFVNIRDGSVNWPVVRKALDDIGYAGWMTIEGGNLSLEEHSQRLDLIIAGK